jgi:hypothetical protein
MLLVVADCYLLKSDILDACYNQVEEGGEGGNLIVLKRTPGGRRSHRAEIIKAISCAVATFNVSQTRVFANISRHEPIQTH